MKSVAVSILNQKLTVRTDADEPYVKEVAGFVSGKIQEVMDRTKSASTLTAALLACLNIADELFRYKEGRKASSFKAANKVRDLIGFISSHFDGGSPAL
jgi:cell division protein ZapA (FtsZ GTPase activity inhibitor)